MRYCLLLLCCMYYCRLHAAEKDTVFPQATAAQYMLPTGVKAGDVQKLLTDYNDNTYLLASGRLYYLLNGKLVPDQRYRALSSRLLTDITVQERTGYLFYLYNDVVLTNAKAGLPLIHLPANAYRRFAVAADGSMLFTGEGEWGLWNKNHWQQVKPVAGTVRSIQVKDNVFYILGENTVYRFNGKAFLPLHHGRDLNTMAFRGSEMLLGTTNGFYGIHLHTGDTSTPLQNRVPVQQIQQLLVINGHIWAGTTLGAFMQQDSTHYRYYASCRWLKDDRVKQMIAGPGGSVCLLTDSGLSTISFPLLTLAQKAAGFERSIRERKIRYGLISQVYLAVAGDITSSQMTDTDNDGLWSCFYLGSQALQYAVTKKASARRYAWETFEAFERLLSVSGIKGFPSRSFERRGVQTSDPVAWHTAPDTAWQWKGTTSSDEFVGYLFATAMMDEMVAEDTAEHRRVAAFIDAILTHILDNGYQLMDIDGKPTIWGRWNPAYINWYAPTIFDRRLGSTTIIAGLQLGYALTGKERYKAAAEKLLYKEGYLQNILIHCSSIRETPGFIYEGHNMSDGNWNHSDDEMAFLSYWVLHRYAFNDSLRHCYSTAIADHWAFERPERNALWNLIAYSTAGCADPGDFFWQLREYPTDLVEWDIRNSHRHDLEWLPRNIRNQYTRELLPPGEQPMHRHNANAFRLDGGSGGHTELAGDEYLLPYWMARYLKLLYE